MVFVLFVVLVILCFYYSYFLLGGFTIIYPYFFSFANFHSAYKISLSLSILISSLHGDSDDEDDLIDKEMKVFKRDYVRTAKKKSIRTNTHKLINKAVANIHAVEKGMFGIGH